MAERFNLHSTAHRVCGSVQRSCAARLLTHSIAIAIENYFPHNEVVRLIVISACVVCSSVEQSCAVLAIPHAPRTL